MLRGKHCHLLQDILKVKAEDASSNFVPLYQTARGHKSNVMIMIFTAVVTLKCRVVLPCFPFSVKLTESVYTQHGTKKTSTECYCRLRRVSDTCIQQTDRHQGYILCVSVIKALLRLGSLISVTFSSSVYICVPR